MIPEPAPSIPPVTALKTLARVGAFVQPYRRQVIYAAIALVVAAAAVLAVGQGLKSVVDRGFGTGDGHQLVNRTGEDVVYLEVGDRTAGDSGSYPDDDLQAVLVEGQWRFTHKDGAPY